MLSRKHRAGVDIHSCSQFLLELYSQWLIPGSPSNRKTPTILISEVVRSVGELHTLSYFCSPSLTFTLRVILCFSVAAGSVRPVHREEPIWYDVLHTSGTAKTPPTWRWDPESVPGPCHLQSCCCAGHGDLGLSLNGEPKSVSTLCKHFNIYSQDKAIAEPVCRLLETTLRSTHLPSRMGALHGVLYVLECDLLDDTAKQLIPTVSEYLLSNLKAIAQWVGFCLSTERYEWLLGD